MKNNDWTTKADAVCLLAMQKYEEVSEQALHGTKLDTKLAFCEEMKLKTTLFNDRTNNGLKQHMDYLLNILKGKIEDEEIKPHYKYLKSLWSKVNVDTKRIHASVNAKNTKKKKPAI